MTIFVVFRPHKYIFLHPHRPVSRPVKEPFPSVDKDPSYRTITASRHIRNNHQAPLPGLFGRRITCNRTPGSFYRPVDRAHPPPFFFLPPSLPFLLSFIFPTPPTLPPFPPPLPLFLSPLFLLLFLSPPFPSPSFSSPFLPLFPSSPLFFLTSFPFVGLEHARFLGLMRPVRLHEVVVRFV